MRHGSYRLLSACLALLLLCAVPSLSACTLGGGSSGGSRGDPTTLATPVLSIDEDGVVSWEPIEGAWRYRYAFDGGYIWTDTLECSVKIEYGATIWVYAQPHIGSLNVGNYAESEIASIRRLLPTNEVTTEKDFEIDLGDDDYYIYARVTHLGETTKARFARRGDSYLVSCQQENLAWYTTAYCKQKDGTYRKYSRYEVSDPRHEEENAWEEDTTPFDEETAAEFPFVSWVLNGINSNYLCIDRGADLYRQCQERIGATDGGSAYLSEGALITLPKSDRAALYYEYWIDTGTQAYRAATIYIDPETHVCLQFEENVMDGKCLEFRTGELAWGTDEDLPQWPSLPDA